MKFCFPSTRLSLRRRKDDFDWREVGLSYPYIFVGTETAWCDVNDVWKIVAPTGIAFERNEYWHSFKFSVLGFGFWYARQWSY